MIIVYLQGGLGNQMFQYAFGKHLSLITGRPLLLDASHFGKIAENETPRSFQLSQWSATHQLCTERDLEFLKHKQNPSIFERILRKINIDKSYYTINDSTAIDLKAIHNADLVFLHGYFQNENYFIENRELISKEFKPAKPIEFPYSKENNTVSIHVRRGDYISNDKAAQHHGVCGVEYFFNAIKTIEEKIDQPKFIFFSDDIEWCKATFSKLSNTIFIEPRTNSLECDDLYWMSQCAHHIISNSSYSWWGAWLNNSEEKIVIAPSKWVASQIEDRNNVVPKNWIQL